MREFRPWRASMVRVYSAFPLEDQPRVHLQQRITRNGGTGWKRIYVGGSVGNVPLAECDHPSVVGACTRVPLRRSDFLYERKAQVYKRLIQS